MKNVSAYEKDEEGNFVPPVKVAQNLCPNDCSFNGNCTNGSCICHEGFIASDCSMRVNEVPRLFRYDFANFFGGFCYVMVSFEVVGLTIRERNKVVFNRYKARYSLGKVMHFERPP